MKRDVARFCGGDMPKSDLVDDRDLLAWPVELLRIVGPDEAERLSTLSWDTIKRCDPKTSSQITQNMIGMAIKLFPRNRSSNA
jgi:hypothetical protein